MNSNNAGLGDLGRIRVLTRELIALLDTVTRALPLHRPKTLVAARLLAAVVKALPNTDVTDADLRAAFQGFDDADKDTGTNSVAAITE
jgi:hypothetical protein